MLNILVVDDSPVDRQLFEGLLAKDSEFSVIHADDGEMALEKIRDWEVDLVLTDLQMPKMNGLELVKAIRDEFPDTPTILTTAYGSEEIANAALMAGAASYVPKSKAGALLLPTVRGVLEMFLAERNYADLLARSLETRFDFELDNDEKYFAPFGDLCNRMLASQSPLDRIERLRVVVGVEHALKNALYRGNLEIGSNYLFPEGEHTLPQELAQLVRERQEKFADRRIRIRLSMTPTEFRCMVQDRGSGFTPQINASFHDGAGRGLVLMHAFLDEVRFSDRGNSVELVRRWGEEESLDLELDDDSESIDEEDLLNISTDDAPLLGTLHCEDPPLTYKMYQPSILVGSQKSCHVVLSMPGIEPHHCQLTYGGGEWNYRAFPSRLGVVHNGRRQTRGALRSGDRLEFGKLIFTIQY